MKANAPKRKIFDAVDMLTGEEPEKKHAAGGVETLPVDSIRPFREHPFRLYDGERLQDMVESIREHGVLSPVIVWKDKDEYEMLAGHNRLNAAKIAGLKEIPAIVKTGLTEEEAYVYVIETNVMQRSFSELLPSEKAQVLKIRYEKISCQGRRNDILEEIARLSGKPVPSTCGHDVHKKSRDTLGDEYGMTGRNIARYLRVNELIPEFKDMTDTGKVPVAAAVEVSYLSEDEQRLVAERIKHSGKSIRRSDAESLHKAAGTVDAERLDKIFADGRKPDGEGKVFSEIRRRYFVGYDLSQMKSILEQALEAWFERRRCRCLMQKIWNAWIPNTLRSSTRMFMM